MHFYLFWQMLAFPMIFGEFLVFRLSLVSFLHPKNALLFIFVTFFPTVTFLMQYVF